MDDSALVVGVTSILAVGVYGYLGFRLAERPVSAALRWPAMQFALFWLGLAGSTLLGGLLSVEATVQVPPLSLVLTFLYYDLLLVCVALWGLIGYLGFLYRGRSILVPVSLLYVLEYGLLVYYVTAGNATSVSVTAGSVNPVYSTPVTGLLVAIPILILVLPEFVAALAYFTLYFRTKDRTVRYRVTLVSWGLIAWFLFDFFDFGALFGGGLTGLLIGRLLILLAAVVVLLAFYPPASVRARLGITAI